MAQTQMQQAVNLGCTKVTHITRINTPYLVCSFLEKAAMNICSCTIPSAYSDTPHTGQPVPLITVRLLLKHKEYFESEDLL